MTFTQPVDAASVTNPKNFTMTSYTYPYHSNYGGEPVDIKTHLVKVLEKNVTKITNMEAPPFLR